MRIVSLCPSNTEIVAALGLTDQLVGVDMWSDYPPSVRDLPDVGSDLHVNIEKVKALKPDLVLASETVPGMERNVQALVEADLPHLVLTPERFTDFLTDVFTVAEACGVGNRGRDLVKVYQARIEELMQMVPELDERPRTVLEWWPKPHVVACGVSWAGDMIEIAGGENVYADIAAASRTVPADDIVARDPQVYLLCWMGTKADKMHPERVYERKGWENVAAVADRSVVVVPEPLLGRPGPRLLDGLELLIETFTRLRARFYH